MKSVIISITLIIFCNDVFSLRLLHICPHLSFFHSFVFFVFFWFFLQHLISTVVYSLIVIVVLLVLLITEKFSPTTVYWAAIFYFLIVIISRVCCFPSNTKPTPSLHKHATTSDTPPRLPHHLTGPPLFLQNSC